MKITCPACKPVGKMILSFFTDIKYFFSKDFIKENYYLHFITSFVIIDKIIFPIFQHYDLESTSMFFKIFISTFGAYFLNTCREIYKVKNGAPYSISDVNFGAYGGLVASLFHLI